MAKTPVQPISDFDPIPEKFVPDVMKADGRYRQGGYRCNACPFVTAKRGFSGKQALRAHLKVHAYERRAWMRPLLFHGITSGILVILMVIPMWGIGSPNPLITFAMDSSTLGWIITGPALIMAILGIALGEWAERSLSGRVVRSIPVVVYLGYSFAIAALSMAWGLATPQLPWPPIIAVAAMLGGLIVASISASIAALMIKRGRWRSRRYMSLLKPRDEDAEFDHRSWVRNERRRQEERQRQKQRSKPPKRSKKRKQSRRQ